MITWQGNERHWRAEKWLGFNHTWIAKCNECDGKDKIKMAVTWKKPGNKWSAS